MPVFLQYLFAIAALIAANLLGGWWAVVPVGLIGGYLLPKTGGRVFGGSMLAAWALLMAWNYGMNPQAMQTLFSTMSGVLGGLPGWGFPVITLVFGGLLGLASGFLGGRIGEWLTQKPRSRFS